MARPKVDPKEKLEKPVPVKFKHRDRVRLERRAKEEHMELSPLIRKFALDKLDEK